MSASTYINPAEVVAPVYHIKRTTDLSMVQLLDQIKPLLNHDFFAPTISQEQWESKALIGTDLDQVCHYLSNSPYTFSDVTSESETNIFVTSQALIALSNTLAPLLNSNFADLSESGGLVKVKVENHYNYDCEGVSGYAEMSSDVTFAMPVHNPVTTCSKSQSTLMHLNLTFTVASKVDLANGNVVLKKHIGKKPVWNFEIIDAHFTMAVKSEHSFKPNNHPNIHMNITPLFYALRHIGDIETRIHNTIALRILKNQDDFSKLLAKYLF